MEKPVAVEEKQIDNTLKTQITFEYYKQQREELMNMMRERTSITLQFLIILSALVVAFFQATVEELKLFVSALMVLLGIIGLFILNNIKLTMVSHATRARAARKSLGFLEEFASSASKFGSAYRWHVAIYVLIIVVGLIFTLIVLVR